MQLVVALPFAPVDGHQFTPATMDPLEIISGNLFTKLELQLRPVPLVPTHKMASASECTANTVSNCVLITDNNTFEIACC